ncbi:MAG: alpha-amylase [Bacteroidales bacterium]|nr:alpha-amylase [Bacteroidales bacterium]
MSSHFKEKETIKPVIYQVFPRIFTNTTPSPRQWGKFEENGSGKMEDYTPELLHSLHDLGVNFLWFTGIIEHSTKTRFPGVAASNPNVVKGEAGSPYAICDYYDVDPAIATVTERRITEFEEMVGRVHESGMKILIDFVPNHTAREYMSDSAPAGVEDFGSHDDTTKFFDPRNNYYYIPNQLFSPSIPLDREGDTPYIEFPSKATGNDCFNAFCGEYDWYETVKLNYGLDYGDRSEHFDPIPDTWLKMRDILLYWCKKGVDGFRCDMVFMVPLPFWHWVIKEVKKTYPATIFIGEIYDVGLYRPFLDYGGFDYLYDKVNLYDTLVAIERHNHSAARLTQCWQTIDGIGDRMLNFLENHDEVRFASKEFAGNPLRIVPHIVVSAFISRGPVMIYYGQELGEAATDNEGFAGDNNRSTIFDYWSYDTMRRWYGNGKAFGKDSTASERWLRDFYGRVLNMCNDSDAIREGKFFDLMYVNLNNPDFDPHRHFAFLRYTEEEILLIAVNFGREETEAAIVIPELAFDMASLSEGKIETKDLLFDIPLNLDISRDHPVKITLPGAGAMVARLKPVEKIGGRV